MGVSLELPRAPWRRRALRREADRRLRWNAAQLRRSPLLSWRAAELTSLHERRLLARSLRGVAKEVEGRYLPSAVPLNRDAVRPQVRLVHRLAERLEDVERPVSARGVLLVHDLLSSSSSGFYCRERAAQLGSDLADTLAALEH